MANDLLTQKALQDWLLTRVADAVKIDPDRIRTDVSLDEYGLDSVSAVSISGELGDRLNRDLPGTLLYEYSTIDELSAHLVQNGPADVVHRPDNEANA